MSTSLLFYSNYCQNCKKIMKEVNKSEISPKIKYICIDSPNIRNKLPQYINSVPSLVVGTTNQIYVGNQILGWIKMQPLIKTVPSQHAPPSVTQQSMNQNQTKQQSVSNNVSNATSNNQQEPNAWHTNEMNAFSDMYSFINIDTSAQGNGGMSMVHNFETLQQNQIPNYSNNLGIPGGAPANPSMPVQYGNPISNHNNDNGYGSIQVSEKSAILNEQMEQLMQKRELDVPNVPSRY